MKRYFVTGIGTGVGKTVVSSMIVEGLEADYWKPIQSGDLESSDTQTVKSLVANSKSIFHPEAYRLPYAMSPHASADKAGVEIKSDKLILPETNNNLIIEGAGGLMVPVNEELLMVDLIKKFECQAIIVSRHYLGSINHTLMTVDCLKMRNIPVAGIVIIGNSDFYSESAIYHYGNTEILFRIDEVKSITPEFIGRYRNLIKDTL